jgi:crotonobetaine/carnitine-CoA ligase
MAGALRNAGVQAGDRVAILCSNRPEFLRVVLGCGWLGAVAVPINTAVKGPQLRYLLENSAARLFVLEDRHAAVLEHCPLQGLPLDRIWVIGNPGTARSTLDRPVEAFADGAAPIAHSDVKPSDTLAILYTSGTTGPSKGVCCPHTQLYWWGVHTARFLDLREGDVLCTTLPLFHTNALNTFFQALLMGATQVLEPRYFEGTVTGKALRATAASHTCWAPWCRSCWRSRPPTASASTMCAWHSLPASQPSSDPSSSAAPGSI